MRMCWGLPLDGADGHTVDHMALEDPVEYELRQQHHDAVGGQAAIIDIVLPLECRNAARNGISIILVIYACCQGVKR